MEFRVLFNTGAFLMALILLLLYDLCSLLIGFLSKKNANPFNIARVYCIMRELKSKGLQEI